MNCVEAIPGCVQCKSKVKEGMEECEKCQDGYLKIGGYCVDESISDAMGSIGGVDFDETLIDEFELDIPTIDVVKTETGKFCSPMEVS